MTNYRPFDLFPGGTLTETDVSGHPTSNTIRQSSGRGKRIGQLGSFRSALFAFDAVFPAIWQLASRRGGARFPETLQRRYDIGEAVAPDE
jgi:hypothetical protein